MKNISKFTKKIFVLSLVGMLTLGVFSSNANAEMKITTKNENAIKSLLLQKGIYTLPNQILDRYGKQSATGRYANKTPDGKVQWNVEKDYKLKGNGNIKISQNITLDGKKIALPMTLSSLGQKYAEFANVDYSKLDSSMAPIIIENTKNKVKMMIIAAEKLKTDGKKVAIGELFADGKHKLGVIINQSKNNIVGIQTNNFVFSSERDLKINGIGVGNTFNEMYAKFGMPVDVEKDNFEDTYNETKVSYGYMDENNQSYAVRFTHVDKKFDGKNFIKTKPNVITAVAILKMEAKED
ncbi:hypothetical protein HMPREF0379_0124 [[Eubacterium] yurii subsp. margaretiae ATCC 43715]|nr:hypothetical protein HMPREF0379_0124 [[Eubacterium] yurii subsp. margaretiae ATCC 43715]